MSRRKKHGSYPFGKSPKGTPNRDHKRHQPNQSNIGHSIPTPFAIPLSPIELASVLAMLDGYPEPAPLNFTLLCDRADEANDLIRRILRAGAKFRKYLPRDVALPSGHYQRWLSIDDVKQIQSASNASAEDVGLAIIVDLCKITPADVVLGVGEWGQALATDLRPQVEKLYPDRADRFITQAEAEQEATDRPFADEPDAFLFVAFERLYGVKVSP